jgi:hypothetical protein
MEIQPYLEKSINPDLLPEELFAVLQVESSQLRDRALKKYGLRDSLPHGRREVTRDERTLLLLEYFSSDLSALSFASTHRIDRHVFMSWVMQFRAVFGAEKRVTVSD